MGTPSIYMKWGWFGWRATSTESIDQFTTTWTTLLQDPLGGDDGLHVVVVLLTSTLVGVVQEVIPRKILSPREVGSQ